jgi:hypothetical protein
MRGTKKILNFYKKKNYNNSDGDGEKNYMMWAKPTGHPGSTRMIQMIVLAEGKAKPRKARIVNKIK